MTSIECTVSVYRWGNAELAKQWPVINAKIPAKPGAADWGGRPHKRAFLIR
ncbi:MULTISPECIES: DUF3470 domain-containing protein [unclassified Dyella]|uniref:DUF3470 domain-containing protein n=1 Tax=unclassified Dyella TaxID=2634549 RepID=UPI000C85B50F|nr:MULTISPECIES: DUF3470 domain-containing protein [unclassified Dyella]MDR3443830.1 DUF3470 domain-containing protein [Dyella sp.]